MDRLHALLILAWALVRSLVAPVFGGRRGLLDFQRSYASDRVPPVSADERAVIGAASRCIACGRCDVGEGARIVRSGGVYAGVMDLMVSASRGMPDFDAAARSFAAVDDARLAELEPLCPARVPMRCVAAFVRSQSARSSEARVRTDTPDESAVSSEARVRTDTPDESAGGS